MFLWQGKRIYRCERTIICLLQAQMESAKALFWSLLLPGQGAYLFLLTCALDIIARIFRPLIVRARCMNLWFGWKKTRVRSKSARLPPDFLSPRNSYTRK